MAAATVEVATIEAERDIALAQEVTKQVEIAADAAVTDDEDMIWLRGELADLRARCETNAADLLQNQAAMQAMSEQNQQMAEQIAVLTAAAVIQREQNPSTPEPGSEPPNPPEGGEGAPGGQGQVQEPPQNPEPPARRRERKWL